jgi:hypothetical protein
VPDAAQLLEMFRAWTDSEHIVEQALRVNPQRLYG